MKQDWQRVVTTELDQTRKRANHNKNKTIKTAKGATHMTRINILWGGVSLIYNA